MIAHITGKIFKKCEDSFIIENNGIGYEVCMTKKQIYSLPLVNEEMTIYIFSYIKEEMMVMYGFRSALERELFRSLNKVSGIGPKLALTIITEVTIDSLVHSIERGDASVLSSVPGIGQKTAARIILELKGKLLHFLSAEQDSVSSETQSSVSKLYRDLTDALANLGFHKHRIHETLKKMEFTESMTFEIALKHSLRSLSDSGA